MARIPDPAKPFIVGDSLGDILAEARIELGRRKLSPGRSVKTLCPACGGGSTREDSLSVKLDDDGQGLAWHCFRGTCGGSKLVPGSGRIADPSRSRSDLAARDEAPQRRTRPPVVKPMLTPAAEQQRPDSLYAMFEKRGISRETVDAFGIYGLSRRWPQLDDAGKEMRDDAGERIFVAKPTIAFPYGWRGEVVNRKFRSIHKQFQQDRDALRTLFNGDAVTSPDEVILCEGEMDVLACWEAGFRQVVSLPDGAPGKLLAEDDPKRLDDQRFDALETCGALLADAERIVIATDADVPGDNLAEEFARRLGRARCYRATWPAGCKDANDVLQQHGADKLRECIAKAAPLPLAGLWTPAPGSLREFLTSGRMPVGLESGIKGLDEVVRLPSDGGWLITVTGIPNHGKGAFLRCWLPYQAAKHDVGIIWFSPEDGRAETLALDIAAVLKGQPLKEAGTYMPEWMLAEAEDWIRERITFIVADDPNTDPTLEWMLERAGEAKRRAGGKRKRWLLVIDPWNEVEFSMKKGESEGQFVGRWLRRLKAWGRAEGASVLIAAHPTKLIKDPKSKKYPVADGYDISGSSNWHNKTDVGITIYRERDGEMAVHCWKAKFRAFGKRQGVATLALDTRTGRLRSIGTTDAAAEGDSDG
jgi:twinkle protein